MTNPEEEREFSELLSETPVGSDPRTPSSLKARLYSALVREQQRSGPLASLTDTVAAGHGICVFERLVQISPVSEAAKSPFFCHVCHARMLAEHFDNPLIFWPNCPYVGFQNS